MPGRLILIGGGGHALVVADAAALAGWELAGFLDDDREAPLATHAPCLGPLARRPEPGTLLIIALGDLARRSNLIGPAPGFADALPPERYATVIHPSAIISPHSRIGPGVFIGPGAIVNPRASIADHAIINSGSIVEHDCEVGQNAHIAPGAILGGSACVGPDTLIGLGARILPGIHIGPGCTIGAGAVVTRDIPAGRTAIGIPAR
jgi:acetyltransferase EpsM